VSHRLMLGLAMVTASACALETAAPHVDLLDEVEALAAQVAALEAAVHCPRLVATAAGVDELRAYELVPGVPYILCRHAATGDEMVKVGDFWSDRYEMSACPGGSLGNHNGHDTTAAGCSRAGVMPQVEITWFQAAAMCANAGKALCTNAQWQVAASGTPDPGASDGGDGGCVTDGAPRATGGGATCRSRYGAEDMIGNYWEWVADWRVAGRSFQTSDGQAAPPRAGDSAGPWGADYGDDQTFNVNGTASESPAWRQGLPAAIARGGDRGSALGSGAFALSATPAPSEASLGVATRCCARGR